MSYIKILPHLKTLILVGLSILSALAVAGEGAGATPEDKNPEVLGSKVYPWAEMEVQKTKKGFRRKVFKRPTATLESLALHVTTLDPGVQSHDLHRHAEEEMFIIKSGSAEILFEGRSLRLDPGGFSFQEANELHSIRNVGDTPLTYHVIKFVTQKTFAEEKSKKQNVLGNTVFPWEEMQVQKTDLGFRREVFKKPTATLESLSLHITTLNPEIESHGLHRHAEESMFIVKSGVAEVSYEGRSQRLEPGGFSFQAANELHTISNVGDTPVTYHVIKIVTQKTLDLKAKEKK